MSISDRSAERPRAATASEVKKHFSEMTRAAECRHLTSCCRPPPQHTLHPAGCAHAAPAAPEATEGPSLCCTGAREGSVAGAELLASSSEAFI